METGERIRAARLAAGKSVEDLAYEARLSRQHINNLESGKTPNPTIGTLVKVAKALDVPLDDLIGEAVA